MKNTSLLTKTLVAAVTALGTLTAGADTLTWNTTDGSWNATDTSWNDSASASTAWIAGSDAVFSGTGGNIAIASGLAANNINIQSGSWKLTGTSPAGTGGLNVASGASLELALGSMLELSGNTTVAGTLHLTAGAEPGIKTGTALIIENGGIVKTYVDNIIRGSGNGINVTINAGGELQQQSGKSSNIRGLVTLAGGNLTSTGSLNGYGAWKLYNISAVTNATNAVSTISAGSIRLGDGGGGNTTFNVADVTGDSGNDLIITSIIGNNDNSGALKKTGAGTLLINSTDHSGFTTNVIVDEGTLATGAAGSRIFLGAISGSRTITVNQAGTLAINGNNQFAGSSTLFSGATKLVINGGTVTNSAFNAIGDVTLNNAATLSHTRADAGISGGYQTYEFIGGSTLSVTGTGTSKLSADDTATAAMHINGNVTFDVADTNAGAGTDLMVTTRFINSSSDRGATAGNLIKTGAGTMEFGKARAYMLPSSLTINGGTVLFSQNAWNVGSIANTGGTTITVNNGGTLQLGTYHALGGSGNVGVVVNSGGTFSLGAEQYMKSLVVDGGTINGVGELRAASGAAWTFKNTTGTAAITMNNDVNLVSHLTLTVNAITGNTGPADLILSGTIHNSGGFTKAGSGTLLLTGNTTYTGTTNVNEGTLKLSGSASIASGNIIKVASGAFLDVSDVAGYTVGTGQTLNGIGTVTGDIKIAGTLSPGESPGTLTVNGNVELMAGSSFIVELDSLSDFDKVLGASGKTLTLDTGANLNVFASGLFADGTRFDIASGFNSIIGDTAAYGSQIIADGSGQIFNILYNDGGHNISLVAIPEPSTCALLAGAAALGLAFVRRRKNKK